MRLPRAVFLIACVLIVGAAHAAPTPRVQKMLPPTNAVKDFATMPGSLQYAKGDDMTALYDGAIDVYTKNGVIDAARQMYQRKDDLIEVTIHTMKSKQAALDFLKYWQKEHKVKSLTKGRTRTSFEITNPSLMVYFVVKNYFVTVFAGYPVASARKDVGSFVNVTDKRIRTVR